MPVGPEMGFGDAFHLLIARAVNQDFVSTVVGDVRVDRFSPAHFHKRRRAAKVDTLDRFLGRLPILPSSILTATPNAVTIAVHNQKARITLKQPDVIHLPKIAADLCNCSKSS
jgi:hypothetical protein